MMRFTKVTNGLFTALQASNSSRADARHEAESARKAAEASQATNLQLQQRLTCRSGLAQSLDVAVASILLKVTSGNPVDLTAEQVSLQKAMDERSQTAERCG